MDANQCWRPGKLWETAPWSQSTVTYHFIFLTTVLKHEYKQILLKVEEDTFINTLVLGSGPPLVLIHGFGGGVGTFVRHPFRKNFILKFVRLPTLMHLLITSLCMCAILLGLDDPVARHTQVILYSFLAEGFWQKAQLLMMETIFLSIELSHGWKLWVSRISFLLVLFMLLACAFLWSPGHSFGCYVCTVYTIKYPSRVTRLILNDPWGVPQKDPDHDQNLPLRWKMVSGVANLVKSPFSLMRVAGDTVY